MDNYSGDDLLNDLRALEVIVEERPVLYAIYARKSTNEDGKQDKSIDEQLSNCIDFAQRKNLIIDNNLIIEKISAKEPDIRPQFRKLLSDIRKGVYSGILSWHPDRLARNMREAGEIIDTVDKEIIRDLQFVSHDFQNTSSGKMMLGIAFVMSKQYSDKLSDDVKRGIRDFTKEGKHLNRPKVGYYKGPDSRLYPDGKNFEAVGKMFEMRLDGATLEEIAKEMQRIGLPFETEYGCPQCAPVVKNISSILRNPYYAGVLKYGESMVNLSSIYDFTPAISPVDFRYLQQKYPNRKPSKRDRFGKAQTKSVFLNDAVTCGHCGSRMYPSVQHKETKDTDYIYYFRCRTKRCKQRKYVRARVITDYVREYLRNVSLSMPVDAYDRYVVSAKEKIKARQTSHTAEIRQLHLSVKNLAAECDRIKAFMLRKTNKRSLIDELTQDLERKRAE